MPGSGSKDVGFDAENHDLKRTPSVLSSDSSAKSLSVGVQIARESEHEIKYRTCSWQKTAALLFSEYICLAMVSFPWSFSVLGMVPGVIVTVAVAATCLYTVSNSAECSLTFGAITAIICFIVSLPRTLNQMSGLGTFSAITMGIAVLLTIIFSGVQSHPFGYIAGQEPLITAIPIPGTSYVAGNQYVTAPAFGSLTQTYKIIAFSFAVPTIIFLGALYSNVAARFVFFRLFRESRHRHSNTIVGWAVWVALVAATWVLAWIIGEVIPFFSDMLSLMSSLFGAHPYLKL
ncbi:hypothetical protein HHX47_DHR2000322 [Lentinula edodes]|nr:hypothetical protein HHX47_DHR2000322 [Lentinula edodes]